MDDMCQDWIIRKSQGDKPLRSGFNTTSSFTGSMVSDSTASTLKARALTCQSNNVFYSLMYGSFGGKNARIWVVKVDFSDNSYSYISYLPEVQGDYAMLGVYNLNKGLFIVSKGDRIKKTTGNNFILKQSGITQAIIYGNSSTCQSDTIHVQLSTGTPNTNTLNAGGLTFTSSPFTAISKAFSIPNSLLSSTFENAYASQCSNPSSGNQFSQLMTIQSQSTFSFTVGGGPVAFIITPFTANSILMPSPSPIFTYSLVSFTGVSGSVSVSPTDGKISIPNPASVGIGVFTLIIQGKLQDCQTSQTAFTLVCTALPPTPPPILDPPSSIVISNAGPPVFSEPIDSINLTLGKKESVILPEITDPDNDSFTLSVNLNEAITFTNYDSIKKVLAFSPTESNVYKAEYEISLTIRDTNSQPQSSKYNIKVIVDGYKNKIRENSTIDQPNDIIKEKNWDKQIKCGLKIKSISQSGVLRLKITSKNLNATTQIVQYINETDLLVQIVTKENENVQFIITEIQDDNLILQLKFQNYKFISLGMQVFYELDIIRIRVLQNVTLPQPNGVQAILAKGITGQRQIPIQLDESKKYLRIRIQAWLYRQYLYRPGQSDKIDIANFIGSFNSSIYLGFLLESNYVTISLSPKFHSQIALNQIWGMLNDLSFMMSLSMVAIGVPGIAQQIQAIILQVIQLDILMTDKWLTPIFEKSLINEEMDGDEAINDFFDQSGFGSQLWIINVGSTSIFLVLNVVAILATAMAYKLRQKSSGIYKVYSYLQERYLWSGTFRFLIQQFQPLLIAGLINNQGMHFQSKSSIGMRMSIGLSIFGIVLSGSAIFIFGIILKKGRLKSSMFEKQYGSLIHTTLSRSPFIHHFFIEGFHQANAVSKYFTVITLIKWFIMSLFLVLLRDYPAQQLQSLLLLSLLSNTLQLTYKPQSTRLEYLITSFNELMTSLYIIALMCLAQAEQPPEQQLLGLILLCIMLFTFFVNVVKVGYVVGKAIKEKVGECVRKRSNRVRKFNNERYSVDVRRQTFGGGNSELTLNNTTIQQLQ